MGCAWNAKSELIGFRRNIVGTLMMAMVFVYTVPSVNILSYVKVCAQCVDGLNRRIPLLA